MHTEGEVKQNGVNGIHTLKGECVAITNPIAGTPYDVRKPNAERITALWNAFNGISTHDAMNIIQVAKSLKETPGAVKYIENGAEMVEALKGMLGWALHTVAQGFPASDKLPRGYDKWKKLLTKLDKGE